MEFPSLSELDFNEIGEWPRLYKAMLVILLCFAIWGAGYYAIIEDKYIELQSLESNESKLKTSFEKKYAKAVNLDAYKAQMVEMRDMFTSMLQQLPRKSEVANLLIDISKTGLINGLEFELFKPEPERRIDFYIELPISMSVIGSYHQLGNFISEIASMPRIVTVHNLQISPLKRGEILSMKIEAKTYRYYDETDE
jgi:type IV pilus assembly protein PilO